MYTIPLPTALKGLAVVVAAGLLLLQTSDKLFAPPASEKAWAVVVGISRYQELPKEAWLDYADADAEAFSKFISSAQGLNFLPGHVFTLTNEQATEHNIIDAISTQLAKKVKPGDSVYIFLAMHGFVEPEEPHDAYLIAYDSKRTELASTAVSFRHLRDDIEHRVARSARVMLLSDACHSGRLAESGAFPEQVRQISDVFGLLASGADESSLEGKDFGGGHGAFTYHLLRGLQGEADTNKDGLVEYSELKTFLQKTVPPATFDRQHPEPFGKPSMDFGFSKVDELRADLGFQRPRALEPATLIVEASAGSEVFVNEKSSGVVPAAGKLTAGLFPPDNYKVMAVARNGLRAVQEIQISGDPTEVAFDGKTLWTAPAKKRGLPAPDNSNDEDAAQQILLAYLKGNAVRLSAADFDRCAQLFQRAQNTSPWPEQPQARGAFCAGRAAIERRDFNRAATLLDESIRLEPRAGYAYNARGLLRMEQRAYRPAIAEFAAASQRAPRWPYPHFNTALAWTALNQTARAEQEYQRAIQLAPRDAWLHYSLAGLYMRINQPDRAEQEYRRALELDLDAAAGHNALGLFFRSRSRTREAETEFRRALQFVDRDVPARLNLARLYEDQREPRRSEQELLDGAARVESPLIHTALGDLYTRLRRTREAGDQYRRAAELERTQP